MAVFRYQVVCVGFWRGKVKRWNTTFHSTYAYGASNLATMMNKLGYKATGDVVGDCSGGVASVTTYDAAGGPPTAQLILFDWQTPGTWIPYTGEAWAATPADTPVDASGESAALLVGPLPGLSSTGKPVTLRKYLHAVPSRSATDFADPDIDPATATALAAVVTSTYMCSPAGVPSSGNFVEPYYFNHQRVRGRRRTTKQVVSQSFSAGVVLGTTTPGSGGLPFQNQ